MNALRASSTPSPSPRPSHRATASVRHKPHHHLHRVIAVEVGVRLGVNVLMGAVAVATLVRLLPYNLEQQDNLKELHGEVAEMQKRVDRLEVDFHRHFDPQQTMSVMQEQSARSNPNQRRIVWIAPSDTVAQEEAAAAERTQRQARSAQDVKLLD